MRRKARREAKINQRCAMLGGLDGVFTYNKLYKAGKDCCKGVRWKNSVQRFEMHLFSGTAVRRKAILHDGWRPGGYVHFTLAERGKIRQIDAPRVQDRQIHKAYTRYVLLPLYRPSMIWNNGASLPGKGLEFSRRELMDDLRSHYRRYGRNGSLILLDFKQFFPSVSHEMIYNRHDHLIRDDGLRKVGDDIVRSTPGERGLPLGVEPSQAEMIAFPSALDNLIKCQLSIHGAGHYMDDYYILLPPGRDAKNVLRLVINKAEDLRLTVSTTKTKIVPLTKPFKFCKVKYTLTENGKVITHGNRDGMKRARRKIKAFKAKIENGEMTYEELWSSVNGIFAYFKRYDDHNRVLKLRRLFYRLFGFSPEKIESFRARNFV